MAKWYIHELNEHHAKWLSSSTNLPGAKYGITFVEKYPSDSIMFMFVARTFEDAEDRVCELESIQGPVAQN